MKATESWTKYEPHGEETQPKQWDGFAEEPDKQWREWTGEKCVKVMVPVAKVISAVKWIFGKKK